MKIGNRKSVELSSAKAGVLSRHKAAGFSLVEVLISIGLLGVGLAMSAALFPAGMIANENAHDQVIGTIVCRNGLALVKARLSGFAETELVNQTDQLDDEERQYPLNSGGVERLLVLGRRIVDATTNDYQLFIISHTGFNTDEAEALHLTSDPPEVAADTDSLDLSDVDELTDNDYLNIIGSVVLTDDGRYAKITDIDPDNGDTVLLDRVIDPDNDVTIKYMTVGKNEGGDIAGPANVTVLEVRTPLAD